MMKEAIQEKFLFLSKFLHAPKQIGSVTPSSAFLAKKMIEPIQLGWGEVKSIAELGSGTGAITKYLELAIAKETKVLLFEKDTVLREQLVGRFPGYACYEDACEIRHALEQEGVEELDCIISGLPFFNFPQQLRDRLMNQIVTTLKPGGLFIAFQYSQQMKKQLEGLFDIEHIHFVPFNVPPAFVYVCRKRES